MGSNAKKDPKSTKTSKLAEGFDDSAKFENGFEKNVHKAYTEVVDIICYRFPIILYVISLYISYNF